MPSVINLGFMNITSPQQGAAVTVGQSIITGMDANRKFNQGFGGPFGIFNFQALNVGNNIDAFDVVDSPIFDQDFKGNIGGNI